MKITADEFFSRYADGERDFFGIKLVNADLSRANWADPNPVGQTINGSVLGEGDLSGTDFRANDMRGCNFSGSKLIGCRFDKADLTGVCFDYADLTNASFAGAKLVRAEMIEANITGANFTGADLTGVTLPSLKISDVVWDESDAVKSWVIETIQYYRKIDFFTQYIALSDEELTNTLKHLCGKEAHITGGNFDARGDWEVIRYDRQRIIEISLDALYGDDPGEYSFDSYLETLQSWANISRGAFQPDDIINVDDYLLEFTLNGSRYTLNPWEDPNQLAPQINSLIAQTGYQFEVWNLSPDCLITVLTSEEKQRLQSERNWSFSN
jgi:Pentapeptide repeats (8 copies)